jgi:hypothetical protein
MSLDRFVGTESSLAPPGWKKPQHVLDAIKKRREAKAKVAAGEKNCGAGAPGSQGFQPGNTCAGGGGSSDGGSSGGEHVHEDANGDGITDAARVGVPAMDVPPPPSIPRLDGLDEKSAHAQEAFIAHYEANPDEVAGKFRELVTSQEGTPVFGTDDAKALTDVWSESDPDKRAENRATMNLALHQTANAIAKRAFVQHLDTLEEGDNILVTVGGCGAGKGFALGNVDAAIELKNKAAVVWDSAGDQNGTESPWILEEAMKRGLTVSYAYVHADPKTQWAHPDRGVVKRASNPKDGRMVDARVFADSYVVGAKNHEAFHRANEQNKAVSFVFIDTTSGTPKQTDRVPKESLSWSASDLVKFAEDTVTTADVPARVKEGALQGRRVWGKKK